MKKIIYSLTLIFILVLGIFLVDYNSTGYIKEKLINVTQDEIVETKILATGDIMYHLPLYVKNYDKETNRYDFSTYYEKMREYIEKSDIVVGNFESTINPNRKISGHPMFNSPLESVEYLKDVGFDILSTANNHCLDTFKEGIETTIDSMESVSIKNFGTYKDGIRKPLIIEKNGIKIGFLGYSEIFNGLDNLLSEEDKYMISPMDKDLIIAEINTLKNENVDFIIAYPHWGVEYRTNPSEFQKEMNEFFISSGVNVVLGSHPHVLQPVDRKEVNGEKIFTIYSMGNSISNQREPWMNEKGVEFGCFVEITVEKNITKNKTTLKEVEVIPTYVNRFMENGIYKYEVVVLNDLVSNGKYRETIDDNTKKFIDENYQRILDVLNGVEVNN